MLADIDSASTDDEAFAGAMQKDGKIIAAGQSNANGSNDFTLARYLGQWPGTPSRRRCRRGNDRMDLTGQLSNRRFSALLQSLMTPA